MNGGTRRGVNRVVIAELFVAHGSAAAARRRGLFGSALFLLASRCTWVSPLFLFKVFKPENLSLDFERNRSARPVVKARSPGGCRGFFLSLFYFRELDGEIRRFLALYSGSEVVSIVWDAVQRCSLWA